MTNKIDHINNERKRPYSHLIDAGKAFDKIQHTFLIKTLNKLGIEGNYLNIIKAIYGKPTLNITHNCERRQFSSMIKNTARMPVFATSIQLVTGSPNGNNRQIKEKKGTQIGKEEIKVFFFAEDTILNVENTEDYTHTHTTVRSNKSQQSSRIQSQHRIISGISIH